VYLDYIFRDSYRHQMVQRKINQTVAAPGTLKIQDGSNMTGTDLCVNKPQCAAAVRP